MLGKSSAFAKSQLGVLRETAFKKLLRVQVTRVKCITDIVKLSGQQISFYFRKGNLVLLWNWNQIFRRKIIILTYFIPSQLAHGEAVCRARDFYIVLLFCFRVYINLLMSGQLENMGIHSLPLIPSTIVDIPIESHKKPLQSPKMT